MEPEDDPDEELTSIMSIFGVYNKAKPQTIDIDKEIQLAKEIRRKNPNENKIKVYKDFVKTCRDNEIKAKTAIQRELIPVFSDLEKYADISELDISPTKNDK